MRRHQRPLSAAAGILALLEEPLPELKSFALRKLMSSYDSSCGAAVVDVFWAEISDVIQTIEKLHEDTAFVDRRLAALVASKVYYHLGSYDDSLHFALGAEDLFDVAERSEYVDTIICELLEPLCPNIVLTTFKSFTSSTCTGYIML
jgi:26S proteasome regulatory subunit N2